MHAFTGKLDILGVFRADRISERCTDAVTSPFGVTGALRCSKSYFKDGRKSENFS